MKFIWILCVAGLLGCAQQPKSVRVGEGFQLERKSSNLYVKDKALHMMGPYHNDYFSFEPEEAPQVLWVTGFETQIFVDDKKEINSDHFCHNTVESARGRRPSSNPLFDQTKGWFIGVSSANHLKTQFPKGFAVPISSKDKYFINSQVANSSPLDKAKKINYSTRINYLKSSEISKKPTPLYRRTLMSLTPRKKGYCDYGVNPSKSSKGTCRRFPAMHKHKGYHDSIDQYGQEFSSHWFVEPGNHTHKTLVTHVLGLESDTSIHYISAHIHKGVSSIEIFDLTENKSIYKVKVEKRNGGDWTSAYSSEEGIPLYRDHDYQLITKIKNETSENIDIMSMLYVYMRDPKFKIL